MSKRIDCDRTTESLRKLFIGNLSLKTDEDALKLHFGQYGEIQDVVVMRNRGRGRSSRCFGFITYKESEMLDEAQSNRPHVIDGRTIQTKRAMPRDEADSPDSHTNTQKIFVGALKKEVVADDLRDYFGIFGNITECELITFRDSGESRGFGFVTFDDYDPVDKILLLKPHFIDSKRCEVKKAISKEVSRSLKSKETTDMRLEDRSDLMGFIGELRNTLSSRYDNDGYQNYEDRFGQYASQEYRGGPMRSNQNYRSDPYDSHRMRRDYY